jgi:uncharacterized protein (DUF488 family)
VTVELCTVGVYGFDGDSFVAALKDAAVDLVADVRRRRGMRGSEYAFANKGQLTERLRAEHIGYIALIELAPPKELLDYQHEIDRKTGGVRARTQLDPEYVRRYEQDVLGTVNLEFVAESLRPSTRPALLCVEADPTTCHRALAAAALAPVLNVPVRHL